MIPMEVDFMSAIKRPIVRSNLRLKCGMIYYSILRKLKWMTMFQKFARVWMMLATQTANLSTMQVVM